MSQQQQHPHLRGTPTTTSSSNNNIHHELDIKFYNKLQSTIETVQSWDDDPMLLAECRLLIPMDDIRYDSGIYYEDRDQLITSSTTRFLQRLVRCFKKRMTWINSPFCPNQCHTTTNNTNESTCISIGMREGETIEEREGQANRVEVYQCRVCNTIVSFPRYNSVRKLLQTGSGRCGEYANLFGLVCRSMGYETRYVLDMTDHVWTEVYINDDNISNGTSSHWIMVDSCEAVLDENSMYEKGWGKQLNCIIAIGIDHVIDITSKYTRNFYNNDFQLRRRQYTTNEIAMDNVIQQCNIILRTNMKHEQILKLDRRLSLEQKLLQSYKLMMIWEKQYANGRISGSTNWKVSRNEDGNSNSNTNDNNNEKRTTNGTSIALSSSNSSSSFYVELFHPIHPIPEENNTIVSIHVNSNPTTRHGGIVVSGVSCAMTSLNDEGKIIEGISIVIVDDIYLGCILQSKCFIYLNDLIHFLITIPKNRIIIMNGKVNTTDPKEESSGIDPDSVIVKQLVSLLPGFQLDDAISNDGIIYIGQIGTKPDWMICCNKSSDINDNGVTIEAIMTNDEISLYHNKMKLKTIHNTCPTSIIGRLDDDTIMSLATQLVSNDEQKRIAFIAWMNNNNNNNDQFVSGYTTKPGSPIYLLGNTSYPFHYSVSHPDDPPTDNNTWNSFLLLPSPLVDDMDVGIVNQGKKEDNKNIPSYEIPIDENFFTQHIGSNLLMKSNRNDYVTVHTLDVIRNCRFIGFYFSAHWCGPCRSFTPMLAEMYEYLKSEYPIHGLEIVFVSSDRDQRSFQQYYSSSMPWLAIPYENLSNFKPMLSMKYEVRGIPAFVILDSMSGEVIEPMNQSRQVVTNACHRGDSEILNLFKRWQDRTPIQSREMLELLESSCNDVTHSTPSTVNSINTASDATTDKYLIRKEYLERTKRIDMLIKQLIEDGMDEDDAREAAIEVEDVTAEQTTENNNDISENSHLNGRFKRIILKQVSKEKNKNGEVEEEKIMIQQMIKESTRKEDIISMLSTIMKYLENVIKAPWTTKFRTFHLSFKVADRITRIKNGIPIMQTLGIPCYGTMEDFVAYIPVELDVELVHSKCKILLEWSKTVQ